MPSREVLQHLMAYIVDLTIVLENLFWLMYGDARPVTRRDIKLAFKAYYESDAKIRVHEEITTYVQGTTIFKRTDRDGAIKKIKDLIFQHRSDRNKMEELRAQTGAGMEDEPWVLPNGS
jgi:hypothetical protein